MTSAYALTIETATAALQRVVARLAQGIASPAASAT